MKKESKFNIKLPLLSILTFLITSICFGDTINGSAALYDNSFKNLRVNGSLNFKNLHVKNELKVSGSFMGEKLICGALKVNGSSKVKDIKVNNIENNGSFKGDDIYIKNNFTVNGSVDVDNMTVLGKAKINGGVKIINGNINNIEIASIEAVFINSKINNITILADSNYVSHIVKLKDNSKVSGNIIFKSGNGEIHLFGNSVVKGKVVGGRIIKKN